MAKNEKRNIQLSFTTEGLDKIESKMKTFSTPISLSIDDKENKKLLKEREAIQKEISKISKKGATPEQIEQLAIKTDKFMQKATEELVKGLKGSGEAFSKSILDGLKELKKAQKELDVVQKERKGFDRRFETGLEGDIVEPKTQVAKEDIVGTGIEALKKQNKLEEELIRIDKKRLASAKNLLKLREDISQKLGKDAEKELENFAQKGIASKNLLQTLQQLRENGETRLKDEQILGRLKVLNSAEEAGVQEKINELKVLENKETQAQANLTVEIDQLLKEKVDLLKEIKNNATPEEAEQAKEVVNAIDGTLKAAKAKLDVDQDLNKEQKNLSKSTDNVSKALKNKSNTLTQAAKQVFNYGVAFSILRRIYRETLRTIRDLDKALTEMATVTTMNRQEAWALAGSMQALAKETGFTATEIAKINTLFLRQGRSVSEAANLTKVAAQAARIASISGAESANFLTSAVNGFGLAASEVLAVSDRFAAIAAQSASSYEELAIGLSKFGAQAKVAGVSMDFAMGLLAKGVETTREAPETIGTALKTVLARMRELTDFGKTLEDGMDISRVEGALRQVGIALRTPTGQFRDMEAVITDIGTSWSGFNREQQASIAVALAGTRQQSRLIAIMEDFDRTLELVNVSQTAAGATNAQHAQFMQGLEAATAQMQNAYQQFITTITDTEIIIDIVKLLSELIEFLSFQFQKLTDSGFNLTKAVVFTYGAIKTLNVVMKLSNFLASKSAIAGLFSIKTKIAETVATGKQIIAQKAANKQILLDIGAKKAHMAATIASTKATTAFTVALMKNPVTLTLIAIAAAITAVVVAVRRWKKETEDLNKELEKSVNEIKAQNFEITRSIKNVNDLSEAIRELNSLPFLTKEQSSELEDLSSRLIDLIGSENLVIIDGIVRLDIIGNEDIVNNFIREQEKRIRENRRSILDDISSAAVITTTIERPSVGGSAITLDPTPETITTVGPISQAAQNTLANVILEEFDDLFSDQALTTDAQSIYANYLTKALEIDPEFFNNLLLENISLEDFVSQNVAGILNEINNITSDINTAGLTLQQRAAKFSRIMSNVSLDPQIKNQLKEFYSDLNFIVEEGIDFTLFEKIGITSAEEVQNAYVALGEDFEDILTDIVKQGKEISKLKGISESAGIDIAFAQAARAAEDATESALLFGIAFKQTNLEVAQGLERIGSRIDNLEKLRIGFKEGTLSATELFDLIDGNKDLFESGSDVLRFLNGESISDAVFVQKAEQEAEALSRIAIATEILNDANATSSEKYQALQDIAFFGAITRHTGDLSSLTREQQNYNASLARYELLASLGIDTTESLNRVINDQAITLNQSANRTIEALINIEKRFEETAEGVGITLQEGQRAFAFENFFQVLEGVVVPKFDALDGLTGTALGFIESIMSEYQNELNSSFEEFQKLRDRDLALQKENFDKQRKVYEDYFAALDRLEKDRERKVEREDLVAQLSRLEGATDERSRRRALELRRELNQLDEQTATDIQTQAREDLLSGFDERYAQLENQWAQAARDFITEISKGGEASANAFAKTIDDSGVLEDIGIDLSDVDNLGKKLDTFVKDLVSIFGEEGDLAKLLKSIVVDEPTITAGGGGIDPRTGSFPEIQELSPDAISGAIPGRKKGGMVDFTGLAMLHGTKDNPEAVLSARQTEMFVNLRNALEKVSVSPNSNNTGISIENISISTASLNNNQDFNRAGETLAHAFKSAIQRKGITVNTNKT